MRDKFKQVQRDSCLSIRSKLPKHFQETTSDHICRRITEIKAYRQAKRIALYQPVNGEIDLSAIWKSAPLQGKYCYFPVITEALTLIFLPATPKICFQKNRFGILEPDVDPQLAIPIEELDVIFMPLVGFDIYGTRLGMGKGYYDRSLAEQAYKTRIGVAYEFQKQAFINPEPWDITLSMVVTESQIYVTE
jgi:5-formyltetrahydrofolate cyclo-ligase